MDDDGDVDPSGMSAFTPLFHDTTVVIQQPDGIEATSAQDPLATAITIFSYMLGIIIIAIIISWRTYGDSIRLLYTQVREDISTPRSVDKRVERGKRKPGNYSPLLEPREGVVPIDPSLMSAKRRDGSEAREKVIHRHCSSEGNLAVPSSVAKEVTVRQPSGDSSLLSFTNSLTEETVKKK